MEDTLEAALLNETTLRLRPIVGSGPPCPFGPDPDPDPGPSLSL